MYPYPVNLNFGNLILFLSGISWAVAQILKVIIICFQEKRLDFQKIVSSGGMPSSHSAFTCACATATGMVCGWSSPLFAVAMVLAGIVMYDASNVRRAAGEQAKILNYMMEHWNEMRPETFGKELKEFLGHTPVQVFAGAILGIAIAFFGVHIIR